MYNPLNVSRQDFWSENQPTTTITNAATNPTLPSVTVAGIPDGATILRVEAILIISIVKDSSGSDNAINTTTMILAVDSDSGYASTISAGAIPDNSWAVDVSEATERAVAPVGATVDVKAEVTGDGTYYFRLENAQADGNNLILKDVLILLRVYYY